MKPRSEFQKFRLFVVWFLPLLMLGWAVYGLATGAPMTPMRWMMVPAFVTVWFVVFLAFLHGEKARKP